jgi:hypothetical protein
MMRAPGAQGKNQYVKTLANKPLRNVAGLTIIHTRIMHCLPIKALRFLKAHLVLDHVGFVFCRIIFYLHTVICIYK